MISISRRIILIIAATFSTLGWAETRYITDQFEVTLRSGMSTSNSILSMLKSGQAVTVLEQDAETRYSLVETADGKQGYVLTRYLDGQPSGRERLKLLQAKSDKQQERIAELTSQLAEVRQTKNADDSTITDLQQRLGQTRDELASLKEATRDTIRVLKQNEDLQLRINALNEDIQKLTTENAAYKDTTAMDWFMRGAGVSLAAFLLGILVTRIRWKKRDSWGSY